MFGYKKIYKVEEEGDIFAKTFMNERNIYRKIHILFKKRKSLNSKKKKTEETYWKTNEPYDKNTPSQVRNFFYTTSNVIKTQNRVKSVCIYIYCFTILTINGVRSSKTAGLYK